MIKKIIALALACVLMLSLVACNKSDKPITLDDVYSADVTKSSLFDYKEVENGISIIKYKGKNEIVVIPDTIDNKPVVSLEKSAFESNINIRAVKIGNNVEIINSLCFFKCYKLEIVICGASLKTIKYKCWQYCTSLNTIILNDGLEFLGFDCFNNTDISEIEIPNSVVEIENLFVGKKDKTVVIIGEQGSAAEDYVNEDGEKYNIVFQAK